MDRLVEEIELRLNTTLPVCPQDYVWVEEVKELTKEIKKNFIKGWLGGKDLDDPRRQGLTRLSAIGKPIITQAARIPNITNLLWENGYPVPSPNTSEELNPVQLRRFSFGHVLESQVITLLKSHGVRITDTQTELVMSEEHGVVGHCDGVVHFEGKRYVFDVKTMSDFSFKRYCREVHDDNGYVSQLACYHKLLGTDGAFILAYNKNTHVFKVLPMCESRMQDRFSRAQHVVKALAKIKTLEDLATIPLPPAVPETYRRRPTGNYLPHPCIKWDVERFLCYGVDLVPTRSGGYKEIVTDQYDSIYDCPT